MNDPHRQNINDPDRPSWTRSLSLEELFPLCWAMGITSFVITVINRQHPLSLSKGGMQTPRIEVPLGVCAQVASAPRLILPAPNDQQFMAPAAPPPPPLSAPISLLRPTMGAPGVLSPLSLLLMSPFNSPEFAPN